MALPQNTETKKYLKSLGAKNIKFLGNIKFFGNTNKKKKENTNLKRQFSNKKILCAASTHQKEEIFIARVHKELKPEIKNLITVIIPRHINRKNEIIKELKNLNLNFQLHTNAKKLNNNTDIYLVDTYGEATKFYSLSKLTFLGGSLIPHGGQNPLEPVREGNFILYGPHIENFKEVYEMLDKLNITTKINSIKSMKIAVRRKINFSDKKNVNRKLNNLGERILSQNLFEIRKFI